MLTFSLEILVDIVEAGVYRSAHPISNSSLQPIAFACGDHEL